MQNGTISLDGEFDLQKTVESGQTFLWSRENGEIFSEGEYNGWYHTTAINRENSGNKFSDILRVRQEDEQLKWNGSFDASEYIFHRLGLKDNLDNIFKRAPNDDVISDSYEKYNGIRLVRDPHFPCLISFICSSQMSISRIHEMQEQLKYQFGEEIEFNGEVYHTYPTPEKIASTSEETLRDIKLGYRAPYVRKTAGLVVNSPPEEKIVDDFEKSRENLKDYMGVGNKVADCVLLYSFGFLQSVPIDTWIESMLEEFYPDLKDSSYSKTSQNIRNAWGEYAGYYQLYLFHYLRNRY